MAWLIHRLPGATSAKRGDIGCKAHQKDADQMKLLAAIVGSFGRFATLSPAAKRALHPFPER
jgi:hypothetical protein